MEWNKFKLTYIIYLLTCSSGLLFKDQDEYRSRSLYRNLLNGLEMIDNNL